MRQKIMILFVIVFLAGLVSAGFELNSSEIINNYLEGEFIKGTLNMSFNNQKNAEFTNNINNDSIELIDILKEMDYKSGREFNCLPKVCKDDYSILDATKSDEIDFILKKKGLFGFKLNGNIDKIDSFQIDINNDKSESGCLNQLSVDLFNDGKIDFYNTKSRPVTCGDIAKDSGCFVDEDTSEVIIGSVPYCEKIKRLAPAPGYKIEANIKKISENGKELRMSIWDGIRKRQVCDYTPVQEVGEIKEDGCSVDYPSLELMDAFICIEDSSNSNSYKIKIREAEDSCGGYGIPNTITEFTADYDINVQPLQYAKIGTIRFDKESYDKITGKELSKEIEDYIKDIYGSDCSGGCVIPLSISGVEQNLKLSSLNVIYETSSGKPSTSDIYKIVKTPFSVNSDYIDLDIEKMKFDVPKEDGLHNFELKFDGETIIEEEIDVDVGFDFRVGPSFALLGQSTTFSVFSSKNISSSIWEFGDKTGKVNSENNRAQHIYREEGEYELKVEVTNSNKDTSTKTFKILVGNAKTSANITIKKYESRIKNVEKDIKNLNEYAGEKTEEILKLKDIKKSLTSLKNNFESIKESDVNNKKYIEIVNKLLDLNVPISVFAGVSGTLPGAIGYNNIETSYVESISDKTVSNSEELKLNIISWIEENYEFSIDFESISKIDESGESSILSTYKVVLTPKKEDLNRAYLIIDFPKDSIDFKKRYDEREINNGAAVYVPITRLGKPNSVEFSILDGPEVENLGIFISPVIDDLGVSGKPFGNPEIEGFNWKIFIISTIILLFFVFAIYIFLQEWYKKYYEKRLFKNPDELYNLINFIYNSRKSGLKDKVIKEKLKANKWKNEQVSYAFNKINGKRTGMYEIPVFKFFENIKVKKEIRKKHRGVSVDARFIKRPNL